MNPDQRRSQNAREELTVSAEQYRDNAARLRTLVAFMHEGGNWSKIDPATANGYRETLAALKRAQSTKEYNHLSLGQTAEALIQRFERKAEAARIADLRPEGDTVVIPSLSRDPLEIIKIDTSSRTYFLAHPKDQRSIERIVNGILSGETREGAPTGYEINWDELEHMAA